VIGRGSASFEILRQLVDRLPVMVCPRWVTTRCQPIALADVVRYLVAAPGPRTYRVDQILDLRVLDEEFGVPEGFELAGYWQGYLADFRAHLRRADAVVRHPANGERLRSEKPRVHGKRLAIHQARAAADAAHLLDQFFHRGVRHAILRARGRYRFFGFEPRLHRPVLAPKRTHIANEVTNGRHRRR